METRRKPVNYINNRDLYDALTVHVTAYKANPKNPPPVSDYIIQAIWQLANNIGTKKNFSGYSFLEDMKADAVENCLRYLHNFDPTKVPHNPFAYLSQYIFNAFIRRIKREQKEQYVKLKNMEYYFSINEIEQIRTEKVGLYDNNYDFIRRYEERLKEKAKIKQAKATKQGVEKLFEKDEE